MGGDLCHHGGELRPSPHLPIPSSVQFPIAEQLRARFSVCPGGDSFKQLNTKRGRKSDEPFFDPVLASDIPLAIETIQKTQDADVQDDVFFIFAHDTAVKGVIDLFPQYANEWQQKGWKEKTLWTFLEDLVACLPKQ